MAESATEPNAEPDDSNPIFVGVGASAGGIDAIETLLGSFQPDGRFSFGVVMHLAPDQPSNLAEILDAATDLTVQQTSKETPIRPDHVYVIPADATMTVEGSTMHVSQRTEHDRPRPIDLLFESLAEGYPGDCVGILLSGAGSDGTVGLNALRSRGHLTLCQSPEEADFAEMPRSAIEHGAVDEALDIDQMAERLDAYYRVLNRLPIGSESAEPDRRVGETAVIGEICSHLEQETGRDFGEYKRATVARRIGRRMIVVGVEDLSDYLTHLRDHPDEVQQLHNELLITVTSFFRDPEAFEQLEEIIDKLVARAEGDELRIWSAGCSSGEEAYSLAMLVREALDGADKSFDIQIFATDIDEMALDRARRGVYPDAIRDDVSDERLARFFQETDEGYRVREQLRKMCLFSAHDLTRDPPFSEVDLLVCRNVLIYLNSELQEKVIGLFHYALREEGYLFLGPAESVDTHDELFEGVDLKHRIYRAEAAPASFAPSFPLRRNIEFGHPASTPTRTRRRTSPEVGTAFQRQLMDWFGPPAVLVDQNRHVQYFSGHLGDFLELRTGPLDSDLLELARGDIRAHLRSALQKARQQEGQVALTDLHVQVDDHLQSFDLVVAPLTTAATDRDFWMVVFRPGSTAGGLDELGERREELTRDEAIQQLEQELHETREHLQGTIRQLEKANEDMKAYNEELLSMNEELQSSNEELKTSQEELQSVNQELERVNDKLQQKVEQLDRANADLQNLLESTQIPTLFLDDDLRIKQFTPSAKEVFRLIESDVDRSLLDITLRVEGADLPAAIDEVLETLEPQKIQVRRPPSEEVDERIYLLRIFPYRTVDDVVDGVVLTFVEMTRLVQLTDKLKRRERQQSAAAELGIEALTNTDYGAFLEVALERTVETLGADGALLLAPDAEAEQFRIESSAGIGGGHDPDFRLPADPDTLLEQTLEESTPIVVSDHRDGRFGDDPFIEEFDLRSSLSCDVPDGDPPHDILLVFSRNPEAFSEEDGNFVKSLANILRSAKNRVRQQEHDRLQRITDATPVLMWMSDPDGKFSWFNRRWIEFTGLSPEQSPPDNWQRVLHPEDRQRVERLHRRALANREEITTEFRLRREDGEYRWMTERARPWQTDDGEFMGFLGACFDITERKAVEEANEMKDEFLAMLGHELRNPLAAMTTAVGVLKELDYPDEDLQELLDILDRQSQHMDRLIDGLLDVSRIQRGKINLEPEVCRLDETVGKLADDWARQIDEAGLEFNVELPEETIWAEIDTTRFNQIVGNLLANAVRFTDPPGEVFLTVEAEDGEALMEVSDTGVGLAEAETESIFEPFQQAERPGRRPDEGLGMGLPLARGLAELHGGQLTAHSPGKGEGATFRLNIPLTDTPEVEEVEPSDAPDEPKRVLVIEDNADIRSVFRDALERSGHEVDLAENGEEGISQARECGPDVVICDIGLPGDFDGNDVARILRDNDHLEDTTLIAISGFGQPKAKEKAVAAGFDDYLVKPVTPQKLRDVLQQLPGGQ